MPLDQPSISRRQVEFIHDFFGPLDALSGRGRVGRPAVRLIRAMLARDSRALPLLVQAKRRLKWIAVPLYLFVARHVVNRQAKVFAR